MISIRFNRFWVLPSVILCYFLFIRTISAQGISVQTSGVLSFESRVSELELQVSKLQQSENKQITKLMEQMKVMEKRFSEQDHMMRVSSANKNEQIKILKVAKTRLENELGVLKASNQNQLTRIIQLEELIKSKIATSSAIASSTTSAPTAAVRAGVLPTSCQDVSSNGHSYNGIYMVYDVAVKKIAALYCNFQATIQQAVEKKLGFVDVKSLPRGVHFYAQRTSDFDGMRETIPFHRAIINEGKGMQVLTGVFRAPVTGIYHFSFKGLNRRGTISIHLRVNHEIIGNAYVDSFSIDSNLHLGLHATLKLKKGDKVDLFKDLTIGGGVLQDDMTPDTHFSGWLLDEELVF